MNNEHTIVKGARRLDACAEYIDKTMSEDGYRVSVAKITGGSVTQVHVAKVGLTGKAVAEASLNLWTAGEDLKFKIETNFEPSQPAFSGWPYHPEELMTRNPFGMAKMLWGAHKQAKLEERLHLATSTFLTSG